MQKNKMRKWIALAVGLLLIACVIAVPHLHKASEAAADGSETVDAAALLERLGLDAEVVESPATTTALEEPYVSRADALTVLNNAELIAECTVEEISRIKVPEPDSDTVWFLTVMTLSRNGTIRGDTAKDRFRVVSAAATNDPVDFFSKPGLADCREGMQAAFLLRSVAEDDVWTIGKTEIAVRELGDYFVVDRLGFDGKSIEYGDHSILLDELE